jgi:hypothetical protein
MTEVNFPPEAGPTASALLFQPGEGWDYGNQRELDSAPRVPINRQYNAKLGSRKHFP